ncbi:MAG TPA: PKD domain-containing protein [Longimicrobium sp.]|nr:PKD domain-containing protein [Longimicrobium sp.]
MACTDTGSELLAPNAPRRDVVPGSNLVITEVMPDPSKVADTNGEWFEVYNPGPSSVDLKNYRIVSAAGLTASESHTISASVVVDSGEYVVFGNNANTATNGGAPVAYSYGSSITLNNGSSTSANEWLALRTPTGVTIDSVAYATRTPPAAPGPYTPPTGASRAVIDLAADNTIIGGSNWSTSVSTYGLGDKGTPGAPNQGGKAAQVTVRISWVTPGTTFKVTASAVDSAGKPASTSFTWSSDNTAIATVDPVTGVATGVSLGTAHLTATATNGVSGTAPLFVVNPGDPASVSISINDPAQVPAGYTKPAFPTVKTTTSATVTTAITWSSSNPAVATVDSLGYITGVAPGTANIRAMVPNGVYGEVAFKVIAADAPTTAIYRNHLEFGQPLNTPAGEIVLNKRQYVSGYNPARGGPDWVSWNINATHFSGVPRCDCFSADQTLPAGVYHVVDFDYRNGGYDRGHMVQSESRTTTDQENASTFLLTNILPQGAENNQGPWSKFENYLNDLARTNGKEIYVVAGGEYAATPGTLKGEGKVAIPDYTWKVAVIMDGGKGLADVHSAADVQVIAIKMPNLTSTGSPASSVGMRNNPWEQYQVTVNQIEAETGYDLLAALPNNIEVLVEANDRAPVAATDGPYNGLEGSSVTLDGSASSDPDGDALTYAWDFGDGATGTGAKPTHTYADNGTYLVTLTVTDPAGAEASTTTQVTVFNVAPSVAAFGGASILAHQTYAAGGTFTDPGADEWTATVDYGEGDGAQPLALSGTGFNLSHTYDHAGTFTVTVTVTDDDGASSSKTATVTVTNVAPAVDAFAGASLLLHQGYAASGSFDDPGPDSWTATVDYGDGGGAQPLALNGKSFTLAHTYAAAGTYTVTVTVTDDGGLAGTRTATVTVTNVAPVVNAFAGATLLPGESYSAAGSFGDPGPDSWTATVDYGDGSGAHPLALSGKSFSLSHAYAAAGTYTVTVTVTDDGGLSGSRTATVTVLTAQQALGNLQAQVNGAVSGGTAQSMNAKLRAAGASLDRGNTGAAVNQLNAFINEVQATVQSGRLSQAQGDALVAAARRILDSIGG